jgi:hypothetical protein
MVMLMAKFNTTADLLINDHRAPQWERSEEVDRNNNVQGN